MLINIKVKTLDSQTHEFSIDDEMTVREFKDKVAEKTNIAADQQRIIYCGRVMVDDKQFKDYDVDGKVVHVAERPPPSQLLQATDSSSANPNPSTERRSRARPVNIRNSPFFRALDGMVVGTMAIPMSTNGNGQPAANPFAASSSFCMNRITVARHMLECADNIAAFLEDPSRGLNNQSLDILARGRWTMESTVVEVGISADMPQNQQIVELVQGAVQAALRRSGNTNVTLVQLPNAYNPSESDRNNTRSGALAAAIADNVTVDADAATIGTVAYEEEIYSEEGDPPTNEPASDTATASGNVTAPSSSDNNDNTSATSNNNDTSNNSRRRTGTPILADVIRQMRTVQSRLDPFIDQYYELLRNETIFDDTTSRENAQRLYNRVSEAFHYMSHAQHAISDLMLDVSQNTPRYLTCRPILVEQSGYVSSNNFLSAGLLQPTLRQQQQEPRNPSVIAAAASTNENAATTSNTTSITSSTSSADLTYRYFLPTISDSSIPTSSADSNDANNATVDDPVDDPIVLQPHINFGSLSASDNTNTDASNNNTTFSARNLRRGVARLLQDVVSGASPYDTEFHVHINPPNVVSIDVPIGVGGSSAGRQTAQATNTTLNNNDSNTTAGTSTTTPPTITTTTINDNANTNTSTNSSSSSTANPARVTTATLPTTSTQTRSTSRPQVHFGNIPVLGMPNGWNSRVLPNNNVSSFDRFLPCNSHHIREPETANNAATNDNGSNNAGANRNNPTMGMTPPTPRASRIVFPVTDTPRSTSAVSGPVRPPYLPHFRLMREMFGLRGVATPAASSNASSSTPASGISSGSNQDAQWLNIHSQLMNCLSNHIFEGQPINVDTIPPAVNRAIQWFGDTLLYLPQYERPEYDSRDSLFNILRITLPMVIELLKKMPVNLKEFEQKLKQICEQFRKRLYSVLYICIGRANAEIFWVQLMRLLGNSIQTNLRGDVVEFLTLYLTPTIPNTADEADAQQFIVLRNTPASDATNMPLPMDTDVEISDAATTSKPEVDDEPLPAVVAGSAPWHSHFSNDWLPILARDIQRQTENPPNQPPFSDAYISGMSSKRRKLVQNSKPPTEIDALIADSVRTAIQNPGLGTSTAANQAHTPEDVALAIANDAAVQTSSIDAVRTNIRERLKKDPDFQADKFPKSNNFIKNKK